MQINSGGSRETRLATQIAAAEARIAELERETRKNYTDEDYIRLHKAHCMTADKLAAVTAHAERLEAALREAQEAWSRYEKFLDLTGTATDIERAYNDLCAALSPASSPDVQLPKGWLTDEFSRVDADVAQWSVGMKDSFKEATGIAIPPAPTPSKRGDDE
jgi:hypothetical protein